MPSGKHAMGDSAGSNLEKTEQRNDEQEPTIDETASGTDWRYGSRHLRSARAILYPFYIHCIIVTILVRI